MNKRKDKTIKKRKELTRKLKELRKQQEVIELKLDLLKERCNHEIIVTSCEKKSAFKEITLAPRMHCLMCGEYLAPRRYLPVEDIKKMEKAVHINMKDYPMLNERWGASWWSRLEDLYLSTIVALPEKNEYEIGEEMKKQLEIEERKSSKR